MNVVVVGPGPKFLSGISYFTWKLCNTLQAQPILFRDMLPQFLFPGKDRVGIVETVINYDSAREPVYIDWWNPLTWMRSVKVCRNADVVVLQWWTVSVALMYAFILLFNSTKVVVEVHETIDPLESSIFPVRIFSRVMRKLVWGWADHIVVHSKDDLSLISDTYKKVSLIPHGVYDQYGRQETLKVLDHVFEVLFYGIVREYKGVKYLIEGFQKAAIPHSVLYICGEHWDKIEDPHDDNITMIRGYLDDWWTEFMFSYASVVVLPYLRASSSGVAHIAMHYGLPIIATNVGGLADLEDYEGMFYVPPRDSDAIAETLKFVHYNYRNKTFPVPERLQWKGSIKDKWEILFWRLLNEDVTVST